ncbi:MAG: alpha/beta fold hydrolase [Mucilaginibacter polytrichastri]|nr:alpha/beta fold hydrolase [Mucilaginibacter polytrichastri]
MKKTITLLFSLAVFLCAGPAAGQTFTSFDGTKIHYETAGEGFPVVLVHGFLNSGANWKKTPLFSDLQKAGFLVVILDLRGNGQSDKPHDLKAYGNNAEIKDIMALMKKLGHDTYDLVGYSRGAILAARQITIDKHIRCAVLGGIGTAFTDPEWRRRKMFAEAFSGKAHLYPEAQPAVNYARSIGADTIALGLQQYAQPSTSPRALSKVRIPVLTIAGREDPDHDSAGDLGRMFRSFGFRSVPGDHDHALRSQEFSDEVIAFLKRH